MSKDISEKKRIIVFNKYKKRCAYCGCKITYSNFHVDHIYPKRRHLSPHLRGSNDIDNLNPSCVSCNCSKASFLLEVWRDEIEKKKDRLLRDSSIARLMFRLGILSFTKSWKFYFERKNNGK